MKYKHIRGATRNLVASFFSGMNMVDGDDALRILARRAFECGEPQLAVDWLTGAAAPNALLSPELQSLIDDYVQRFPQFLASMGAGIEGVRAATMSLRFEVDRYRETRVDRWTRRVIPYTCHVLVIDDREKQHSFELSSQIGYFID